ncbi:MAG: PIN domain-containing protein [Spirochaetales bacterium]|nr:PIN domain-containing protein [Spirochaetales bacterium]
MSDKIFIDTNILVYSYDRQNLEKQKIAQKLIKNGILNGTLSLSAQVLTEFFTVVTKKIDEPLTIDEAERIIEIFYIVPVIEIDFSLVKRAIDTFRQYHLSFWDSLIIAAAERASCTVLYSEDLTHNQVYNGIPVNNPFI